MNKIVMDTASQEGISINQFISSAVAEKISAIATEEDYLTARAARADRAAFKSILDQVSARQPLPEDEVLPKGSGRSAAM